MNITSLPNYNSLSFQGYSRQIQNQIDNILRKPDDIYLNKKLSESLKDGLQSIITPKKYIEEGTHNTVYSITRKYALRVPKSKNFQQKTLPQNITISQRIFSKLKYYFGEAILEFGDFQILRNLGYHKPAGIPEHLTKIFTKSQIEKYYLDKYLPRFAHIPQANYDNLAEDINKLNEINLGPHRFCTFDSLNPNNIVMKRGNLYLVDEIDTFCDRSYSNTTAKLLEVFINRATKDMEAPSADYRIPLVRKIFKKVVLASTKADLLSANSKWDYKNWEIALKKCKINQDASEVLGKLDNIDINSSNKKNKIINVKNYINLLFLENPITK